MDSFDNLLDGFGSDRQKGMGNFADPYEDAQNDIDACLDFISDRVLFYNSLFHLGESKRVGYRTSDIPSRSSRQVQQLHALSF